LGIVGVSKRKYLRSFQKTIEYLKKRPDMILLSRLYGGRIDEVPK